MIIGITGGIASGKSSTLSYLSNFHDFVFFDADTEVYRLYKEPNVVKEICCYFGDHVLKPSGEINREMLRNYFLDDLLAKQKLEEIFHSRVKASFLTLKNSLLCGEHLIADIPLLYEGQWQKEFDKVVLVSCSSETQLFRLMQRSGLDRNAAQEFIKSQLPLFSKESMADYVLWNEGKISQLHSQIDFLKKHIF